MKKRTVFFLSDHTGITVEMLGRSLLTQFEGLEFEGIRVPYINTDEKAQLICEKINQLCRTSCSEPFVFSSITDKDQRKIIQNCDGFFVDFFDAFIGPLEKALKMESTRVTGKSHGFVNYDNYHSRINAVSYTMDNDDGANIKHYDKADLILIGVSRSGKTPTCLYLALQFGLKAANYPLTDDELNSINLPDAIKTYRDKIFGLTINPEQLHRIRQERRPNSRYSSLGQCQKEVAAAEELFQVQKISFVNTSAISVEEIATTVLQETGLEKHKI